MKNVCLYAVLTAVQGNYLGGIRIGAPSFRRNCFAFRLIIQLDARMQFAMLNIGVFANGLL